MATHMLMQTEGVANEVRRIVARYSPRAVENLPDDSALGEGGVGLDSISFVEVLLECETRFGLEVEPLLADPGITIGALIRNAVAAGAARR